MTDTVSLYLYNCILDDFRPFFKLCNKVSYGSLIKEKFNPEASDFSKYGYLPNVTIFQTKVGGRISFKHCIVQLSIPKIIFGTNSYEVREIDLQNFAVLLAQKLALLGIHVAETEIVRSVVKNVAFSFNFILPESTDTWSFLEVLDDLGIKRYKQVKKTVYAEKVFGESIKYFNKQTSLCFYDKAAELKNTAVLKEAVGVVKGMENGSLPANILRIEFTLQGQRAVKQYLGRRLGGEPNRPIYLYELFNDELCKSILKSSFGAVLVSLSAQDIKRSACSFPELLGLAKKNGLKAEDALAFAGYCSSLRDIGITKTKDTIYNLYGRNVSRYQTDNFNDLLKKAALSSLTVGDCMKVCINQLEEFKAIRPDNHCL